MNNALLQPARALISVSDKLGIVEFAHALAALGIDILSTGGTARLLAEKGIEVTEVSDYTGFPEMMSGRVKTLHPKIHGGILGRRGVDDDVMQAHNIAPIDMVIVNLYPFASTVARADCTLADAIENIDIGGSGMLRAAAKNHRDVTVIANPEDYPTVLTHLKEQQGLSLALRFDLAVKAFEHTAHYDGMIASYLGGINSEGQRDTFPRTFNLQLDKVQDMRYGENPHQKGAFYREKGPLEASVSSAQQLRAKHSHITMSPIPMPPLNAPNNLNKPPA